MTITIDHDIPLPTGQWGSPKYPFADMQIGDSFLVPNGKRYAAKSSGVYYALKNGNGFKASIRKTADGYRCWRIR